MADFPIKADFPEMTALLEQIRKQAVVQQQIDDAMKHELGRLNMRGTVRTWTIASRPEEELPEELR